jgi:GNAT superfamily N-acetyltransferase
MSDRRAGIPNAYRIEPATPGAVGRLPAIEVAAAALFPVEDLPADHRADASPVEPFERAAREGRLWVAVRRSDGEPVGFALVTMVDGSAHLHELDVHPDHGRKGLGAALVRAVVKWARQRRSPSVTLTTFRHLPWNAPFYRKLGFEELCDAELTEELAGHLEAEAVEGLDRSKRVAMRLDLAKS